MLSAYINIFLIFALMFMGYYLTYKQLFNNLVGDVFSKLVLQIALPANMFLNITRNFSREAFLELFNGMIIPLISMLVTFAISYVYVRLGKVSEGRQGAFSTMFTCSNTIFIGLPINLAIFGEQSVPYVLLYYIVNTTLFWTIGIYLIAKDHPQIEQAKVHFHPVQVLKKIFSPALLGFLIGVGWVLLNLPMPQEAATFLAYLGNLTTPLSMFVIGIIVYNVGIRNLTMNKDIFGVLIGRYLFSPLIVWLLGQWIPVPPLMLSVFIIQAAMPVQNSVPILARSYGGDQQYAAASLGYSVLIYLLYIPLLLKLIL
ncbi:malate transporter [Enterococcus florum]|uniref:Malate transporter n=1 Tax=Enterococcus florum TaxID=2480627 RepID=A0A4P5P6V4_9ENTE|nr:AEC family transporter [Enterococcus florum]GCF93500.1 malate transporter [Enterococcus florum]